MDNANISKYTVSFGLSLALCSILNALLVVAKEKSQALQGWMQKATGYQWVTHVVIILVLFALFGFVFAMTNGGRGPKTTINRLAAMIVTGVVAGGIIITGFYLTAD